MQRTFLRFMPWRAGIIIQIKAIAHIRHIVRVLHSGIFQEGEGKGLVGGLTGVGKEIAGWHHRAAGPISPAGRG